MYSYPGPRPCGGGARRGSGNALPGGRLGECRAADAAGPASRARPGRPVPGLLRHAVYPGHLGPRGRRRDRGAPLMTDPFTLGCRHVLVTGAGQGIGRCIALTFAEHGAGTIVVNDLLPDRADAVAAEIRDAGGQALAVAARVHDLAPVEAVAEGTRQRDAPS